MWLFCSHSFLGINPIASLKNHTDGPLVLISKNILVLSGVTEAMSPALSSVVHDFIFTHICRHIEMNLL